MHLKWTGQNKSTLGILEDLVMFFTWVFYRPSVQNGKTKAQYTEPLQASDWIKKDKSTQSREPGE